MMQERNQVVRNLDFVNLCTRKGTDRKGAGKSIDLNSDVMCKISKYESSVLRGK